MSETKGKILRTIFLILLIITCIIIFNFSAQVVDESDAKSKGLLSQIIDFFIKDINEQEKAILIGEWNIYIRKLAHFSIYTMLGIWTMAFMNTFNISNLKKSVYTFLIGTLYAASDEFHQSLVPGRGPSIIDVGIDSAGVIAGICIVLVILGLYKIIKRNKK